MKSKNVILTFVFVIIVGFFYSCGEGGDDDDDTNEEIDSSSEDTVEEIKRLILNLLNGTEMSTPELRRYFKLSNSQIWKVMSDLENNKKVKRAKKKGRAVIWTIV